MPTPIDRIRLAALATLSERTVHRAYEGASIASTTRARLVQAARELGLPEPPQPATNTTKVAA